MCAINRNKTLAVGGASDTAKVSYVKPPRDLRSRDYLQASAEVIVFHVSLHPSPVALTPPVVDLKHSCNVISGLTRDGWVGKKNQLHDCGRMIAVSG